MDQLFGPVDERRRFIANEAVSGFSFEPLPEKNRAASWKLRPTAGLPAVLANVVRNANDTATIKSQASISTRRSSLAHLHAPTQQRCVASFVERALS